MAKRKRLSPPPVGGSAAVEPQVSQESRRPPIAYVAGDAAAYAAADKLADELAAARREGRLVLDVPLAAIEASHILRDRLHLGPVEMAALKSSIKDRGQQTPLEVVDLGEGRYGLISGWRRMTALQELYEETSDAQFSHAKVLIKTLPHAADAYVAMVEENEIRAPLSFYECAQIAWEVTQRGVFKSTHEALKVLYANATPARRSKIASFIVLHQHFADVLRFPEAIPEKVGLKLVKAHDADKSFKKRLRHALAAEELRAPEDERRVLDRALVRLERGEGPKTSQSGEEIAPNLQIKTRRNSVVLSGLRVDDNFVEGLRTWLREQY